MSRAKARRPARTVGGLTRRQILLAGAAVPVAGAGAWALSRQAGGVPTAADVDFAEVPAGVRRLRAATTTVQLRGASAEESAVWAYEASVPGPEIRAVAGDRVRVRVENALPQPTAVHWHGVSIDNAMDGVPGLTQDAIPSGGVFDYDFAVPHAGTFWYHTHDRSWEQNARGLHGPLIVEEPEPYDVDRELTLVIDDWRLDQAGQIDESSMGAAGDWSHGGRTGNHLTVNGQDTPQIDVRAGERIRARVINTANARIMGITFDDLPTTLVALDGHPTSPRPADEPVVLGPAQRADLVIDLTAQPGDLLPVMLWTDNGPQEGAFLRCSTQPALRTTFPDVPPLPARPPSGETDDTVRAELLMEGGAMGGMSGAMMDGQMMPMTDLMAEGRFWAFNGVAGDLDAPLMTIDRGRTAAITIRNMTAFPHTMHLHGHHFTVLTRNGAPDPRQDRRDTELMASGETIKIAFAADNPGSWLLHCHMLEHAAAGMATWVEVT